MLDDSNKPVAKRMMVSAPWAKPGLDTVRGYAMGHYQRRGNGAFLAMDPEARGALIRDWLSFVMETPDIPHREEMLSSLTAYHLSRAIRSAYELLERHHDEEMVVLKADDMTASPPILRKLGISALMAADFIEDLNHAEKQD